ncbi:MAG: DUF5990 family protein [Pseudolysinimonas sp.]
MEVTVLLTAELPDDPSGSLTIGLQRGDVMVDPVAVAGQSEQVFTPTFRVEQLPDGRPNFLGPFAHGTRDARFFYLVWRRAGARVGRSKIPLAGIDWADVATGGTIALRVRLVNDHGRPRFATVRPL